MDFDQALIDLELRTARQADETRRREAGVAIVDVEGLMRELVLYMPRYKREIEASRYLEAVKDIAIHINAVTFHHGSTTGELREGGSHVSILPESIIKQSLEDRSGPSNNGR